MKEIKQQQPEEFLSMKKVFMVGSLSDETVLIAVNPIFDEHTLILTWWDTIKDRIKQVKSFEVNEDSILHVTDIQDDSYTFVPLSLQLYNNVVRDQLLGKREFVTDEEMVQAFEDTMDTRY